jgi:hypothetical protein
VKLEVQIDVSAELIEHLNAGRLDVVFAKRPLGTSNGRPVWREPLIPRDDLGFGTREYPAPI